MASNAEDDESDVGEISGGEEQEMEFTDGDGLQRMSSTEAPQLVGAGEEGGGEGGRGEDSGEGGGGHDGDGGRGNGSGDDGGTDPFDDDSDDSFKSLSDLDESHPPDPGSCPFACKNDFIIDCDCECDRCMFKYLNENPPNRRRFNKTLRENFRSSGYDKLADRPQRFFRARRPYDYTQDSATSFCTQMIPWGVDIRHWNRPCPNKRRRERGRYAGRILPCDERFCYWNLEELSERYNEEYGEGIPDERGLPDALWTQIQFPADDGPTRPYVCESHIKDSKEYFRMGPDVDNLYKAHLVRFCQKHETDLLAQHRAQGLESTCTCRNVDFTRWQCRSCFQTKVETLQRNFRRRVNPRWRGDVDTDITNAEHYQGDWKKVRRMLQRQHPCLKGHCGRPRLKGIARNEVLDCRCCGGYVVQPNLPPLRRSARLAKLDAVQYEEESTRGSSDEFI